MYLSVVDLKANKPTRILLLNMRLSVRILKTAASVILLLSAATDTLVFYDPNTPTFFDPHTIYTFLDRSALILLSVAGLLFLIVNLKMRVHWRNWRTLTMNASLLFYIMYFVVERRAESCQAWQDSPLGPGKSCVQSISVEPWNSWRRSLLLRFLWFILLLFSWILSASSETPKVAR
jgi:cell division protein FtsW (lipid II flippase)